MKNTVTTLLFSMLLLGLSTGALAQDRGAAVQAFNKALEYAKAEQYQQAIDMYNQAIAQAEQLGEEGSDIVDRSENQLPSMYYQLALTKYKQFQKDKSLNSLETAIESFNQAGQMSSEYGNDNIAQKTEQVITQLLYTKSILQFRSKDFSGALASLDQAIQRNPNYAKAYYQRGLVVKNQGGELDEVLNWFNQAMEVGQKVNDNQIVRKAREAARDELIYRGSQNIQDKRYQDAIDLLERALTYDEQSADAHYRLAEAYNKRAQWDQAIEHAQKSLEFETGGRTDKAKIYFELGTAYKNKANTSEACKAFANAAYGSFKSPAEHQMEFELKCNSSTN